MLQRMKALPAVVDQQVELLKAGLSEGIHAAENCAA